MSDSFRISKSLKLPRDSVTWVFAFLAKRGAGKTYCSGVLAEEMLKAEIPIVVIDGMGTWWGLRVGKDGEGPGLPIVVFGGDHGDIPLVPEKAKEIARAIVQTNISAVLDLSGFSKYISRKVVMEFLDELYKQNRIERHIFIEETDLWAPQRTIGPDQAYCLSAVDNFVRRGGNHNLGCSMITQRSAVLNKDILTQSDCLVVLRTLAPQDKKAIQAWVEEQTDTDRKQLNTWYDSLKSLDNGEAYVWHPEKPEIFKKITFRERETFHATRKFLLTKKAETIKLMDVNEFIEKFKNVFEPKPKPVIQPKRDLRKDPVGIGEGSSSPYKPLVPPTVITTQPPTIPREIPTSTPTRIPTHTPKPVSTEIPIRQDLPTIILEKVKTQITLASEPSTPLGRVLVILKNWDTGPKKRWTVNKIKELVKDHAWPDDNVEDAVKQLVQWEILRKQTDTYLHFYGDRVRVVETESQVTVE